MLEGRVTSLPQAASSSFELDALHLCLWYKYLLRTMCFRAHSSTLPTVVRDEQARSESVLDILWEKEVFFLLAQLHRNPFTGSAQ